MNLIKVLPAPKFTEFEDIFEELSSYKDYKKIEPRFGKTGWYFNRASRKSWLEFIHNDSVVAFEENSPLQFLYELELASFKPITKREASLMKSFLLFQDNDNFRFQLSKQSELDLLRDIRRGSYRGIIKQRNCLHEFNNDLWCNKCLMIKPR